MKSLGIGFPFIETNEGGVIGVTKTDAQKTKANLTAFLTLKKGQRVMNNSLYSPLYNYIFEQWDDIAQSNLTDDLTQSIYKFFPEIQIQDIIYDFDEINKLLNVTIRYILIDLKISDNVSVIIVLQS